MCKRIYTPDETKTMQNVRLMQPHVCYYCKIELKEEDITLDHKLPVSRGGETIEENLVIACKACNSEKSDMTEEEYKNYLMIKFKTIYNTSQKYKIDEEENKLESMQKDLEDLNKIYLQAEAEYNEILKQVANDGFRKIEPDIFLQRLQFAMWKEKSTKNKFIRHKKAIEMQMNIIQTLKNQKQILIKNQMEEFTWQIGSLKIEAVNKIFNETLLLNMRGI